MERRGEQVSVGRTREGAAPHRRNRLEPLAVVRHGRAARSARRRRKHNPQFPLLQSVHVYALSRLVDRHEGHPVRSTLSGQPYIEGRLRRHERRDEGPLRIRCRPKRIQRPRDTRETDSACRRRRSEDEPPHISRRVRYARNHGRGRPRRVVRRCGVVMQRARYSIRRLGLQEP